MRLAYTVKESLASVITSQQMKTNGSNNMNDSFMWSFILNSILYCFLSWFLRGSLTIIFLVFGETCNFTYIWSVIESNGRLHIMNHVVNSILGVICHVKAALLNYNNKILWINVIFYWRSTCVALLIFSLIIIFLF